jgi:hypothetical protein
MNGAIQVLSETASLAETPQEATARGRRQADALAAQLGNDLARVRLSRMDLLEKTMLHTADVGLSTAAGGDNAGG